MKKLVIVLSLIAIMLIVFCTTGIATSADTADVTINAEGSEAAITNTPGSYDFGTLQASETANTANDYFTCENVGSENCDVTIKGTDMTGGAVTWTLADDGNPGDSTIGLKAGIVAATFDVIVKKTAAYNTLFTALVPSTPDGWHLKIWSPTANVGNEAMTGTVTLTATVSA